jgi:hypothetical protein
MCEKSEKVNNNPWQLALLVLCGFLRTKKTSDNGKLSALCPNLARLGLGNADALGVYCVN